MMECKLFGGVRDGQVIKVPVYIRTLHLPICVECSGFFDVDCYVEVYHRFRNSNKFYHESVKEEDKEAE